MPAHAASPITPQHLLSQQHSRKRQGLARREVQRAKTAVNTTAVLAAHIAHFMLAKKNV
jgi:hypothetical protein